MLSRLTGTVKHQMKCPLTVTPLFGAIAGDFRFMRRRKVTTTLMIVCGIVLLGLAGLFVMSLTASRPTNLGVTNGRLAAEPSTPNCVSTQAVDRSHWISPITYEGSADDAMAALRQIVSEQDNVTVVEQTDLYLATEFCSRFFRFVDDVEFLIEPESQRIHFRSASRVGHSDMGANRSRMEKLRLEFEDAMKSGKAAPELINN